MHRGGDGAHPRISAPGQRARVALALLVACATPRPPVDLELDRFALRELRGQPVLVFFFATWCLPCLAMLPALTDLRERKGAQIVAVGMDLEGEQVLGPFRETARLPFPVLAASAALREGRTDFGPIGELPATALVDREGRIQRTWTGLVQPRVLERAIE